LRLPDQYDITELKLTGEANSWRATVIIFQCEVALKKTSAELETPLGILFLGGFHTEFGTRYFASTPLSQNPEGAADHGVGLNP
jgi:hypothetical protein